MVLFLRRMLTQIGHHLHIINLFSPSVMRKREELWGRDCAKHRNQSKDLRGGVISYVKQTENAFTRKFGSLEFSGDRGYDM